PHILQRIPYTTLFRSHDWEELAAIAGKLLDHRPACNLVEEIQSIRQAKFEHALAIANEMRTKYLSGTLKPRSNRRRRQRQSGTEDRKSTRLNSSHVKI